MDQAREGRRPGAGAGVHSDTAAFNGVGYPCNMQLVSIKAVVATVWVLAVCLAGIAGSLNALSSWLVLAGIAVLPPTVMMWRWNDPPQSMSESIQEARR